MCVLETIWETIEWNRKNENKYIIKDMIRWKILERFKKTFQINIVNGLEIMKITLTKQKSSSNELKMNNNRVKKIIFLYYLINEMFMLLNS